MRMKDYYEFCKQLFNDRIYYEFNTKFTFLKTTNSKVDVDELGRAVMSVKLDWETGGTAYDIYLVELHIDELDGIEDRVKFITGAAYMFNYHTYDVPELPIDELIEITFYSGV